MCYWLSWIFQLCNVYLQTSDKRRIFFCFCWGGHFNVIKSTNSSTAAMINQVIDNLATIDQITIYLIFILFNSSWIISSSIIFFFTGVTSQNSQILASLMQMFCFLCSSMAPSRIPSGNFLAFYRPKNQSINFENNRLIHDENGLELQP